jgi:hypothetical protein
LLFLTRIAQLERVQRRFLKSAIFMLDGLYPPGAFLRNFCWIGLVCSLCQTDDWSTLSFFCINYFMDLYIVLLYSQESILGFLVGVLDQPIHSFLITPYRTDAGLRSPVTQMLRGHEVVEMNVDIFACRLNQVKSFFRVWTERPLR